MRRSRRKWESSFNYNVSNSLDSAWKSANSLQVVFPIFVRDKYSSVGCIGTTTYRNTKQKQGADSRSIYLLFLNVPCVCHNVLNVPNQNAFAVLSLLLKIDRRQTSWHFDIWPLAYPWHTSDTWMWDVFRLGENSYIS